MTEAFCAFFLYLAMFTVYTYNNRDTKHFILPRLQFNLA